MAWPAGCNSRSRRYSPAGWGVSGLLAGLRWTPEFRWSRIPIGLLYKIDKPTYEDTEPVLQNGPLVDQQLGIREEVFYELLAATI